MQLSGYIILGTLIIAVELCRHRTQAYDFLWFFNVYFFIVYVVAAIFITIDPEKYVNHMLVSSIRYLENPLTPWLIIISYILFLYGFFNKKAIALGSKLKLVYVASDRLTMHLACFGILLLVLSIYIYCRQYGGIMPAFIQAELIRSAKLEGGGLVFFKQFFPVSVIGLYFSYYMVRYHESRVYKKMYGILFVLYFMLFIITALLKNSRGYIIISLSGLYFISSVATKRYYFKWLILVGVVGVVFILFGDQLFYSVPYLLEGDYAGFKNNIIKEFNLAKDYKLVSMIKEFSHPIVSLEASLKLAGHAFPLRYCKDIVLSVMSLVPERFFGIKLPGTVAYLNTQVHYGLYESIIPPGLLGFFSYSLSYAGVLVGMFFYGLWGRVIQTFLELHKNEYGSATVFFFIFAFAYGSFVMYGEPRVLLMSNMALSAIILLITYCFSRILVIKKVTV